MVAEIRARSAEAAYARALAGQESLRLRAQRTQDTLCESGSGAQVRAFMDLLARNGRAGINMTIQRCLNLLSGGAWLNVYDAVARETGLQGKEYVAALRQRLQDKGIDWYARRRSLERILRFPRDTRYASLNVGGMGPYRQFGSCCVLLDLEPWLPRATCFAGDSLLTCFDRSGTGRLTAAQICDLYAVAEDWARLVLVSHAANLHAQQSGAVGFDPRQVRSLLEHEDSILEIHLHGPVTKEHIWGVVMGRGECQALWSKYKKW
jgi:hypothetical protein